MRSIWKGSIGFGLVNIPVKLYSATEESNLPFITLDRSNGARIRYKKINDSTGRDVQDKDIVKAYKMGESYVLVEEDDFKKATPEKLDHLEIVQFVSEKEIDAVFYEKPYYLEPEKTGVRAYALLRDALKKEGKAALGPLVYHKREWVCLIKPQNNLLVLHRLRFAEEIRAAEGLILPKTDSKAEEIRMAAALINQLTKPFDPTRFKDEFSEKLLRLIEAKAKGKSPGTKPLKLVHSSTTHDLMDKLKASLKSSSRRAS
ncbi:MAG TPA: Ku protein [Flavisolibacter sp.]|nr:Ku protein [Flavisolibacter sp.]